MSLALIQESAKEVRRLAIAGSPLAVGDFRLKKLAAPLEQAGAKVPVFAQVAKSINELVDGKEAESAAHLLSLSTLLNAILYTQGQTGADGELKELEVFSANISTTKTPARVLKPIIEALTRTGSGRFEIVKSAVERGAFNDLRLIEPSIRALDDTYPELADLVAKKILPSYGPGIIPLLKQKLDLKGKKSDARRLHVLHQLDPAGSVELCKTALEQGSPEVKVEAIACLSVHEECLPLILDQTKAKNKAVREAALDGLAVHDRPETTKLFKEMLQGKPADLVVGPMRLVKSPEVFRLLLSEAGAALEKVLENDGPSMLRVVQLLECLRGRKDPETEKFLLSNFARCDKLVKVKGVKDTVLAGVDLVREMAELLGALGSPQCLEAILTHRDKVPADCFRLVLHSALHTWPTDKVFQEFSPLLEQKKGAGKNKSDAIQSTIWMAHNTGVAGMDYMEEFEGDSSRALSLKKVAWDPRWLDAAIKADQQVMVCCLARPDHKGVVAYLLKLASTKNQIQTGLIFEALARCQYPKLTELFIELVKKKTKAAQHFDWELQRLLEGVRYLPATDLPALDAFAATLDEKFVDRFLEALEPLRSLKEPN